MDIVIAATLVDTLRYRLCARADLLTDRRHPGAAQDGPGTQSSRRAARQRSRERLAVASRIAPHEVGRRRPGQADALAGVLNQRELSELRVCRRHAMSDAQWSAAVRALNERPYRDVQAQIEHFIRTTGRDW